MRRGEEEDDYILCNHLIKHLHRLVEGISNIAKGVEKNAHWN